MTPKSLQQSSPPCKSVGLGHSSTSMLLLMQTPSVCALQVRKLSVKRITAPLTYDSFGQIIPNGLYDSAMGPADINGRYTATTARNYGLRQVSPERLPPTEAEHQYLSRRCRHSHIHDVVWQQFSDLPSSNCSPDMVLSLCPCSSALHAAQLPRPLS